MWSKQGKSRQFNPNLFRQWTVLFLCVGLIAFFLVVQRRMYQSANNKLTFDQSVLIIENSKLLVYFASEFFLYHQFYNIIV